MDAELKHGLPGTIRAGRRALWRSAIGVFVAGACACQGVAHATEKSEINFFPVVGGDSDVGVGFGEVSNWALVDPTTKDFSRRVENATFITFKLRNGKVIVPFVDVYFLLTIPRFGPEGRLRLEVRPSFTDERTLGYYGIGNASQIPVGLPAEALTYRRTHPTLAGKLRIRTAHDIYISATSSLTYSWLDVASNSYLAMQQTQGPPEVRAWLGSWEPHATWLMGVGLEYDTRDNETVTRKGQWHQVSLRGSPALGDWAPYSYLQANVTACFYTTPIARWLNISARLVGDALLGSPPFYELARFDDTPAIGGGKALRGVPAQRYHGKVKVFGNLEARSELFPFTLKGKPLVLGVAVFVDAGRTWTELGHSEPLYDGHGWGLKHGVGTGLRLQEGATFVVRADVAWSPDAHPIGGYFAAGQIF